MTTNLMNATESIGRKSILARVGALIVLLAIVLTLVACGTASSFAIEGKWKNTGEGTYGQMQTGAIVTFDGTNCNVFSPSDTYAFYKESGQYRLDVTGLLGGTSSFTVTVNDDDHIELSDSFTTVELTRVS